MRVACKLDWYWIGIASDKIPNTKYQIPAVITNMHSIIALNSHINGGYLFVGVLEESMALWM